MLDNRPLIPGFIVATLFAARRTIPRVLHSDFPDHASVWSAATA